MSYGQASNYFDPKYSFKDRLYFLFGTAGLLSAGDAFAAAIGSGLPGIAAMASLTSFFIMLVLMAVSFCIKDITLNRLICSVFLNFFMFPILFWVTGGVDCGMMFYFILGLCVSTLILEGKTRIIVLILSLAFYMVCLCLGFRFPNMAYPLSYEERSMDIVSSFLIVSLFIIAVIMIMSMEYQKEHAKVIHAAEILKRQAVTDNLTTLYNQRFLIDALEKTAAACRDGDETASILLLDIDDFKRINDSYGHLRGNQVLCQFAALLKKWAGEHDIVSRYGGEEFILLFAGKDREEAMQAAEQIRIDAYSDQTLKELTFSSFSVSGGVSQYSKGIEVEEWIRRSDMNMYAAK